jgi:NhaP-type Na+/H+ or K+/H+ antiporter
VLRLIVIGVVLTALGMTFAVELIFGLGWGSSIMLGAVLVVSGPTVMLPLLQFVRPSDRVRSKLKWEGVLIDPIGALLGVVAFTAVQANAAAGGGFQPGEMAVSIGTGLIVGALGAGTLWVLLGSLQRSVRSRVAASLLTVVAAVVAADLIREDSGFVAATTTSRFFVSSTSGTPVSGTLPSDMRRVSATSTTWSRGSGCRRARAVALPLPGVDAARGHPVPPPPFVVAAVDVRYRDAPD